MPAVTLSMRLDSTLPEAFGDLGHVEHQCQVAATQLCCPRNLVCVWKDFLEIRHHELPVSDDAIYHEA